MKSRVFAIYFICGIILLSTLMGFKAFDHFKERAAVNEVNEQSANAAKKALEESNEKLKERLAKQYEEQAKRQKQFEEAKAKEQQRIAEANALALAEQQEIVDAKLNQLPPTEEPKAKPVVVKELPKPVTSKEYTNDEIKQARQYIGSYRYIKKEIRKVALKCVMSKDNNSTDVMTEDELVKRCEVKAGKMYNMQTDEKSVARLEQKYQEQLKIAKLDYQ